MSKTSHAPLARSAGRGGHSVKLFISYSHQNRVWMERLAPLLNGFQYDDRLRSRPGLQYLHTWHDQELTQGNPWDGEIKDELDTMDVFVPLVSAHFFASWYIQNVELKRAQERFDAGEILVVPILLYDLNLRLKCAFLHQFNTLPASDKWWSSYPDACDAHRLIDDGLWGAIDQALNRSVRKNP
jgi:hypothetical protein